MTRAVSRLIPAFVLRFAMSVLLAAGLADPCPAHGPGGHGPPPPPKAPRRLVETRAAVDPVYPLRWSWLHWWEANRDAYLQVLRQGPDSQDDPATRQRRDAAVQTLAQALGAEAWQLRASAALALGQMREASALPSLAQLARRDPNRSVRDAAHVAVGLVSGEGAERVLLDGRGRDAFGLISALIGLGVLAEPGNPAITALQQTGRQGAPEVSITAAWALRHLGSRPGFQFFLEMLNQSPNPWLVSEALLALGQSETEDSISFLADVLLAGDRGRSIPAWRSLEHRRQQRLQLAGWADALRQQQQVPYDEAYSEYLKAHEEWTAKEGPAWARLQGGDSPPAPDAPQPELPPLFEKVPVGVEEIYAGHLRAAAAIALGNFQHPAARRALLQALAQRGDEWGGIERDVTTLVRLHEYSDLHKGMAIMSLGRIGDAATLPVLVGVLEGRIPTLANHPPAALKSSPLRGYAALALGLYARPVATEQGPVDRPKFETVAPILAKRMADPAETSEVRTAAAIALGLSGRTENLRYFHSLREAQVATDATLRGYVLLGRGMLGDRNILPPAEAFLKQDIPAETMSTILGRRATVLAVGLVGIDEAIPILLDALNQAYHVNREAALAFSLFRSYGVTETLIELITRSNNPLAQAFGARCLGELFAAERPQRLARLASGSNYAMRNDIMLPYRSLANEFLFLGLIPAFGTEWP